MRQYKNYILTGNSVVIQFEDGLVPVDKCHPLYADIKQALSDRAFEILDGLIDTAARIVKHANGQFWLKDGVVMIGDKVLEKALSDKLLAFVEHGIDVMPLVNFHNHANDNPDPQAVADLFDFLDKNHYPLTADGCFVAYKRVRENFMDHFTGTVLYEVGKRVSMPREECCSDRNQCCAAGLHAAPYEYADTVFSNGPLIEIKINPRDVVSVPLNYSHQKLRFCDGEVLRVAAGPRKELVYPMFHVGEHVLVENEDGSEMMGVVVEVLPAAEDEVEASYRVKLDNLAPDAVASILEGGSWTYKESRLSSLDATEDDEVGDGDEDFDEAADNEDDECDVTTEDLNRRLTELEKNAATKKDVADSTSDIVGRLDGISRKMNNAAGDVVNDFRG